MGLSQMGHAEDFPPSALRLMIALSCILIECGVNGFHIELLHLNEHNACEGRPCGKALFQDPLQYSLTLTAARPAQRK